MSVVVYTAVIGNRDKLRNDISCLTGYDRFADPRMNAKIYKVLAHRFINSDFSIWVDANVRLNVFPQTLVEMMGPTADCAVFRHCERKNIYEEGAFIITRRKDTALVVNEQLANYRRAGWVKPDLGMCFLIVRRHTEDMARRNEQWWADICRYSVRDQISFPPIFDGAVKYFPTEPISGGRYFTRVAHAV